MKSYDVYVEDINGTRLTFRCMADSEEHAKEQILDEKTHVRVLGVMLTRPEDK